MFRRFTSLLVVWFGLLTIIVPSMTCAAVASHGDCCPPEGAPTCGECPGKRAPRTPNPAHCVTLPPQAVGAAVVKQGPIEQGLSPDAPVIQPTVYRPIVAAHCVAESSVRPEYTDVYASSAAFTYLVTGRLRL